MGRQENFAKRTVPSTLVRVADRIALGAVALSWFLLSTVGLGIVAHLFATADFGPVAWWWSAVIVALFPASLCYGWRSSAPEQALLEFVASEPAAAFLTLFGLVAGLSPCVLLFATLGLEETSRSLETLLDWYGMAWLAFCVAGVAAGFYMRYRPTS